MILVLGGTTEARLLAAQLHGAGTPVISSLAGRVSRPRLPVGEVRVGGFGGPDALAAWLREHGVSAVIDATHPFAERIGASAAYATRAAGVPLLRLERPGWTAGSGDRWTWVDDLDAAAARVRGRRAFLTTGRQGLAAFAGHDAFCLIRCVEPPDPPLPRDHALLLDRGPYALAAERALLDTHAIDVLVTKDSGGTHTEAKLVAARERAIDVVVVRRPPRPDVPTVYCVEDAVTWAR